MKVKVKKFIEASEKNGYPWAGPRSLTPLTSFHHENNILTCVIGQGLLNLKKRGARWPLHNEGDHNAPIYNAFTEVMSYNDQHATSYEDAIRFMKEKLTPFENEVIEI